MAKTETHETTLDPKFTVQLSGKTFVLLEGLLDLFHRNGGKSIEATELDGSTKEMPKFRAVVSGDRGTFTGHGDASAQSVNRMIVPHIYRMAETRAVARALRLYNNIGMTSFEELGGDDAQHPAPVAAPKADTATYIAKVEAAETLAQLTRIHAAAMTELKPLPKELLSALTKRKNEIQEAEIAEHVAAVEDAFDLAADEAIAND